LARCQPGRKEPNGHVANGPIGRLDVKGRIGLPVKSLVQGRLDATSEISRHAVNGPIGHHVGMLGVGLLERNLEHDRHDESLEIAPHARAVSEIVVRAAKVGSRNVKAVLRAAPNARVDFPVVLGDRAGSAKRVGRSAKAASHVDRSVRVDSPTAQSGPVDSAKRADRSGKVGSRGGQSAKVVLHAVRSAPVVSARKDPSGKVGSVEVLAVRVDLHVRAGQSDLVDLGAVRNEIVVRGATASRAGDQ
jgi:hypothetical protein